MEKNMSIIESAKHSLSIVTILSMWVCYEMISLRAKLIHQYILKQRTFSDIKQVLNKSTKTLRQWIAIYKAQWEQWLFPKKPWPKSWTSYNRTAPEIENIVEQLARIHRFEWPISLCYRLEGLGYKLNQSTIYRILKRKWLRYHPHEYVPIQRHTKRYVKELPWQEVQIDVSFPFWRSRKLVVYDGIDDCTRIIWSRSYEGYGTNQSLEFIKYLITTMPINISAVRTDCGREFSKEFTDYCNNQWIIHIKNKPYTPQHNGKVERYHYTQRLHCVSYRPYTITVEEANYKLTQRWAFYNTQRRHTWLGMNGLTPIQKLMSVTHQLFYHNCHLNSATQQELTYFIFLLYMTFTKQKINKWKR